MRVAEQNRLEAIIAFEIVKSSVEEHTGYLDKQIKQTQAAIRQHINSQPDLRRQSELLDSISGIAETTAAALLAEIVDVTQYRSARQVAAYAGLVPRERYSGSSVRGGHDYQRSVTRGYARHSTFRLSRLCVVVRSFKHGQQACGKEVNAR